MQVSCPQCSAKLQLSAEKLPDHPFVIKCPKCECGFQVTPEKQEEVLEIAALSPAPVPAVEPPVAPAPVMTSPIEAPVSAPAPAPFIPAPPAPVAPAPVITAPAQAVAPPPQVQIPVQENIQKPVAPAFTAPARPVSDLPPVFSPGMAAVGFTNSMPTPKAWDADTLVAPTNHGGGNDLLQALTLLLAGASGRSVAAIPQTRRRYVISCLSNEEAFAKVKTVLGEKDYFVTAAESPEQVTSLLQSSHQLDILLLDPSFHSEQQGGASIMRYLNMLNPARRRRVFVVVVSQTYKTMDTQAAFSHGVNMIVNSNELEMLPGALVHTIGDFNNLYRAFNEASGIAAF
jgi:CheY-like chemotaxis protein